MAFAAELAALTGELVEAVAGDVAGNDAERINNIKDNSTQQLRHSHLHARTNQFEIKNQLEGLEERLRIVNRDGLADALGDSLARFSALDQKWAPDLLAFLWQLSDKPVQKTRLGELDLLKAPQADTEPTLTWDEIAKEDGWADDRHLWRNINFADDSSDEEIDTEDAASFRSEAADEAEHTEVSDISEVRVSRRLDDLRSDAQDVAGLEYVTQSQSWRLTAHKDESPSRLSSAPTVSETQTAREVIYMLRGLNTTLFDEKGVPRSGFSISHISDDVLRDILLQYAQVGRQLSLLRAFVKQKQVISLIQVFQSTIEERLMAFDLVTTKLETELVGLEDNSIVSLRRIMHDLDHGLQALSALSNLVREFLQTKYPHPFRYLELLFDAVSDAQLEGNYSAYKYLGTIFLECFKVYLRPIRTWMEAGELADKDKIFFVSSAPTQLPAHQVWQNQYKLRTIQDGTFVVPRFLHPSVTNIFTAGKSIVMLKLLGKHYSLDGIKEPPLDFSTLTSNDNEQYITPFPEVFNNAFKRWMETKHHAAYATLRQVLLTKCNLLGEVDSLRLVYLMADGSRSSIVTRSIFHNLDLLNANWHDRLGLTQLLHEAFESAVDSRRLGLSVATNELRDEVGVVRTSVRLGLPLVRISYHLAWPLRIVISDESLSQYQAVFTFILQLRRAIYTLHKHKPLSDGVAGLTDDQTAYYRIRTKMLWFYNILDTYITMLVIGPLTAQLRTDLENASDIDAMISVHSSFTKRMVDEVCLGSRLDLIKQCILDVLDLSLKLEDARQAEASREEEATQELSRLSLPASPGKKRQRYMQESEMEDETFIEQQDKSMLPEDETAFKDYSEVLADIAEELDRHMKFLCSGLRGVARASSNPAAAKWDTLAEMLESGVQEQRSFMS